MTAIDIVTGYLNSLRGPFEADPDQRWFATYDLRASVFLKFFKWLTQLDLEVSSRQLDACHMPMSHAHITVWYLGYGISLGFHAAVRSAEA